MAFHEFLTEHMPPQTEGKADDLVDHLFQQHEARLRVPKRGGAIKGANVDLEKVASS